MGGIPVPIGIIPQPKIKAKFTLPSGGQVVIRQGKGRDLRLGLMAAGANADQYKILFALLARLATIDGQMITVESVDEMDLEDVQVLLKEGGAAVAPLKKTPSLTLATEEDALEAVQEVARGMEEAAHQAHSHHRVEVVEKFPSEDSSFSQQPPLER